MGDTLLISDLHLSVQRPGTTAALLDLLRGRAREARALYVLGDLFDAWIGDDDLAEPMHAQVAAALRAVADRVVQMAKASGQRPLGVEGEEQGEWVLVDLPDVMVHVMLPRTREFYQLEQLWTPVQAAVAAKPASTSKAGAAKSKRGPRAGAAKTARKPGGKPASARNPGGPGRSRAPAARRRPPQGG